MGNNILRVIINTIIVSINFFFKYKFKVDTNNYYFYRSSEISLITILIEGTLLELFYSQNNSYKPTIINIYLWLSDRAIFELSRPVYYLQGL